MRKSGRRAGRRVGLLLVSATALLAGCGESGDADAGLEEARQLLLSSRFNEAHAALLDLSGPEGAPLQEDPEFRYLVAMSGWHSIPASESSIGKAADRFKAILNDFPESPYGQLSLLNLGRIAALRDYPGDTPRLEEARDIYRQVITANPEDRLGDEAALMLAESYVAEFDDLASVREGMATIEALLERRPETPYRMQAHFFLGDVLFELTEDVEGAVHHYRKADALGIPDENTRGKLYWKIAHLAEDVLNDPELAVEYYTKVVGVSGGRAFEATLRLEQLNRAYPALGVEVPERAN